MKNTFNNDQVEAINMLEEEGLKLISTPLQIKHGTLMFQDTKLKYVRYSITASGYARRHIFHLESYFKREASRILKPGDYSGLAEIILRAVNKYRRDNNVSENKQETIRAKKVNESLNEDIFSHLEMWTYKKGDEVRFQMKDVSPEDFEDNEELAESHNGQKAIISSIATATATVDDLGDKNFEYYDIEFGDGIEMIAVSGYHLEPIYKKKRNIRSEQHEMGGLGDSDEQSFKRKWGGT